jgi:site-specific recombinase XerD
MVGLDEIQPIHVAAYIEQLRRRMSPPSIKQHLACIRMLFDWLITGRSCWSISHIPSARVGRS